MRRLRWTLAAFAASGCSLVFPTGDYTNPRASGGAEAGATAGAGEAGLGSGTADGGCGSAMPAPPGYGEPVFEDAFCASALDATKWLPYMPGFNDRGKLPSPLSGPNDGSFETEYFAPSQVASGNGLVLTSVPDGTEPGFTAKSGVVTTTSSVRLDGGSTGRTYIQLRAKIASHQGMWPRAYLGPLVGGSATPIGIFSTGFIDSPLGGTPLSNLQFTVGPTNGYFDTKADQSLAFADYGVEIVWGSTVTWFWNPVGGARQQVLQKGGAPPSASGETLFLELSVINGRDGSSGWHTVWNGVDQDAFAIAEVQVYAK